MDPKPTAHLMNSPVVSTSTVGASTSTVGAFRETLLPTNPRLENPLIASDIPSIQSIHASPNPKSAVLV